jgi:hypothetical protein
MAQATRSLSPKLALERMQRHRHAVITLAVHSATKAVKRRLRAQGIRLHEVTAKDIRIRAEAYFEVHRAELIAQAERAIATWPGFARWRCPPEVSVKSIKIEHSPNANSAIVGQIAND